MFIYKLLIEAHNCYLLKNWCNLFHATLPINYPNTKFPDWFFFLPSPLNHHINHSNIFPHWECWWTRSKLSVNCIFTKVCKIIPDFLKSSYPKLPTRNIRSLISFELQQQMCWTLPGNANAPVITLVHMNLILLVAIIIYGLLNSSDT